MIIGLYRGLISFSFPLIYATYIRKRRKNGKEHPTRFNERLGVYTHERPKGKLYWFHGASVGEAISMLPLIDKMLKEDEDLSVMVTTGTLTSAEIMAKRLPERAFHQFVPFDVPRFAKRLLEHFKPDAVLWFESELWPSMLSEVKKKGIPLILVNGRISDKSFRIWRKFLFVAKELLGCFCLCLGQSEQDKNRLQLLGAKRADCVGNLKYAGMALPVDENKLGKLKAAVEKRRVFLLSSTHHNEEEQFCFCFKELQRVVDGVLVIIAPRHPQRGKEIYDMLQSRGFAVKLRSAGEEIDDKTEIYVADTIGEMGLWYRVAEVTFVGGSLIAHGGQNFMEPARDKNAVLVGPYMHNFVEMLARAKVNGAVWQVQSAAEAVAEAEKLFREPEYLEERARKAYAWTVEEAKVLEGICRALKKELKQ